MFVVISKFAIHDKGSMTTSVKSAFVDRPHLVDQAPGFVRMDVLSPLEAREEIWLLTYWTNQTSFQAWYRTHQYQEAHAKIPAGLKLKSDQTEMRYFEHVAS